MKYTIKVLAIVLAMASVVSMVGCGKSIFEKVEATAIYTDASGESGGNFFSGNPTIVTDNNGGFTIEDESEIIIDDNGVSTTRPTTTRPTTTRPTTTRPTTTKPKTVAVPVGVTNILKAYNAAANRTKAHNNMIVDKTNDVEIYIDEFAGSANLATLATNLAGSFMKQYNGQSVREIYKNGRPTINTTERDLQYKNTLCNDKKLFIPVRNKSYMCSLRTSDVISATATRLSASTYKVVIKLKSESTDLNTPPAIITRGMDYFEQKVFNLKGFEFTGGTADYRNCVITGIVNADGYLDYAENKMSVSSTNAKVTVIGLELDAKLHGDYITTLKFQIK